MNQSGSSSYNIAALKNSTLQNKGLYVAIGLDEEEAGYPIVSQAADRLGDRIALTSSLWHITTQLSLQDAFREINSSMVDRRIENHTSLLVVDPVSNYSKWHLRQPLSDLMCAHWNFENNLFISFALHDVPQKRNPLFQCLTGLGTWAPLSRTIWYLSTSHSSKDVFQQLLHTIDTGDQLCVFDSQGHLAIWQDGEAVPYPPIMGA